MVTAGSPNVTASEVLESSSLGAPKKIAFALPVGFHVRTLLRSGLYELLKNQDQLSFLWVTPAYQQSSFLKEFSLPGRTTFADMPAWDVPTHFKERLIWKLCRIGYSLKLGIPTLMRWNAWHHRQIAHSYYGPLFEAQRPDLLVTASPGYNSFALMPIIWEAQAQHIPVLCITNGWDNLCGLKGMMPTRPDHLSVWNPLMQAEAIGLHRYRPDQVTIVGPPQFDIYQKNIYQERGDFFRQIGMDPDKALITIATATAASGINNDYIVDMLSQAAQKNLFIRPVQFLCRLHPLDRITVCKDIPGLVKVERPSRFTETLGWDPDREEMIYLANTLKHSDVVVNIASTVAIEASVVDTPVVNVAFHPTRQDHFKKAVLEEHWQRHYRYVQEREASTVVTSENELIAAVNRYLEDPQHKQSQRKQLAEDLCFRLDGAAHVRIYDRIMGLLKPGQQAALARSSFSSSKPGYQVNSAK